MPRALAALAAPDDRPPKGWTLSNGVVSPGDRVADFAAREQRVEGVCRARGCWRRVQLEPRLLSGAGLGLLAMTAIERTWRCQRLEGCGLDFRAAPAELPLRLSHFTGRPNVRLRLRCQGPRCTVVRLWRVEEMIAGLQKRRQGGPSTRVADLGGMMTTPCPACKKASWTAEVLWIDTATMGWKVKGERSFDGMESR
jgi:hypothetical protein